MATSNNQESKITFQNCTLVASTAIKYQDIVAVDISPLVHEELRHSLMKQLIQNGGPHFNPSAFGERPTDREQF